MIAERLNHALKLTDEGRVRGLILGYTFSDPVLLADSKVQVDINVLSDEATVEEMCITMNELASELKSLIDESTEAHRQEKRIPS